MHCRLLAIATVLALTGCAKLDSGVGWAPDWIKEPPPQTSTINPEARPDLEALLREEGASAFSSLHSIRVSDPMPDGSHWQFCAQVSSAGVTGEIMTKTYLVKVDGGSIGDRRPVGPRHFCSTARFRSVSIK